MIYFGCLLVIFAVLVVAGFVAGNVAEGHQAVRFRFGKRVIPDRIFDEGMHWIIPLIESLKQYKVETVSAALREFEVQTGTYVNARVSVSCEWRIDQDRIHDFSHDPNVVQALEGTLKEITAIYFRYISSVDDMYNATMVSTYSDVLFDAVRKRVIGERPVVRGDKWSSLRVDGIPGAFSRLGINITGMNVQQVDFPNLVRDAQQRNLAGSIEAKTVRETAAASADAVAQLAQAGATPDIALLQNERIIAPHVKRTEVPDHQNILIQQPYTGGAPVVGGYLPKEVRPRIDPAAKPEDDKKSLND